MDVTADLERAALNTLGDAIISAFDDDDDDENDGDHESYDQQAPILNDYININLNEFHSLSTDEVEANLLNECPKNDDGDGAKSDEEEFIGFNDDVILKSISINNEQNAHDAGNKDGSNNDSRDNDDRDNANGDNDDRDNDDRDNDKLQSSGDKGSYIEMEINSRNVTENSNDMEELNIKMEFTCESEKIIENQIETEYFIHNYDDNNEIEIYSTSQSPELGANAEENDELENLLTTSNDSMREFLKFPIDHLNLKDVSVAGNEDEKKTTVASECVKSDDLIENLEISSIMSDHNYTSQEINAPENTLRHNLINHILNKTTPSTATSAANINNKITPEVTEFVEKILESINTFQILDDDNEKQKCNITSKDAVVDKSDTYDDDDRDLFVQNIIDAVIAEDYAEYAESKAIELNSSANKSEKIKKCEDMKVEKPDAVIKKEVEIVEISTTDNNYEINEIIAAAAEAEDTLPKGEEISSKAEVTSSKAEETLSKAEKTSQEDETLSNAEPFNNTKSLDKIKDQLETTSTENFMISPDIPATTSLNSLKTVTLSKVEESETEFETDIEMQENCSEPLEHMQFEEAFDLLSTSSKSSKNKLDLLTAFAKVLYNDCVKFATSKMNIDDKLQKYIKEQFHIFKSLACNQNDYIEQSQQTDPKKPKLSARKLRKLNKKNKKVLLESSSDSSSTDSSSTCGDSDATVLNTEIVIPTAKKLRNKVKVEDVCAPPPINNEAVAEEEIKLSQIYAKDDDDVESSANHEETEKKPFDEYDDGVSLAKYIQSEIFETDSNSNDSHLTMSSMRRYENNDDDIDDISVNTGGEGNGTKQKHLDIDNNNEILNESDKENASSISKKKEKDKKNKKLAESSDEDENDKEIERLINLNALSKRPPTSVGSMKSAETTKKIKAQSIKSKNNIVDFSDDDGAIGVPSNESMSEDEEEVITEEQYLARYNENLKQQLLNGSSSDSEEVEDDLNDVLDEVISDEDGNKSPLIDKFLKSYNVEESDEEENEAQTETTEESLPAQASTSLYLNGVEENATGSGAAADDDKSLGLKKSNLSNTPDNSDCELLNESLLFRKRTRPKTLEKMLSEADKRKKISKIDEDLISLSSESECSSGVEAVEETNNSRILKPMLRQDQLAGETRKAQKHETDRIRRLEKKQTMMAKATKEHADLIKSGDLILDYIDETKTFIKVHPGIVKHLKKHQFEGVKFMYDSCYGGVEALKKNSGSGCILAHCMGLGKTLQLIALLHTVITFKELKTTKILVLCPKSTVMNWADEVVRWLGPINAKNLKVYTFNDTSDINEKLSVMREWSMSNHTKAGCLLIGYEAFRTLVFYHSYKNRGNISAARLEDIRDKVDKYLLQPGADLVVCDEGHIIKNSKSAISLAVAKIVTPKRIILTGTPIQNNLKEYYSMVNFIKPLFLGTEKEFANLYANPIKNGQHKDSNKRDIKVMKQRSFVLHKKLSKFVQRKEAALLKTFLPQKFEYVLFIPMTAVQNNLYEYILEAIQRRDDNRGKSLITDYTCLRKIWTHPKVLEDAWKNATQKYKRDQKRNLLPHSDDDQPDDIYDSQTGVMSVTNDWWRHLVTPNDLETILPSNKLRTMFEILRVCEEKGEKCLIFSAFVAVLNVVEYFFSKISDSDPETLKQLNIKDNKAKHSWISGQDYYRLDGKTSKSIRHEMVKRFNSPNNKRARVFLISAKAGGQGINLIGANRVIILDTSWNPSNDQQNIFRIFRLGQKKNCYIYRVIAMGTMEEKVYSRSVTKQAMSFRVVDEQQIDRHYSMAELAELYTLTVPNYAERPMPVFPQDSILASLLLNYPDLVYKYHEHDSLLENKVEQELSEQEKADAWAAYEKDLQLSSEIRELSNFDDLQNNFAASSKMQNYLSTLPGFDQMQSFLNYGALGQQTAALSPFMQSFLSQYNYSTQNQQYMEMMYKRMAQSTSMGAGAYPDINSSLASMAAAAGSSGVYNTAAAAAAYTQSASKPPSSPSTASLLSSLHASGLSASPLSALGDLSMYGLGGSSGMGSMGISSKATLPHSSNPVASMSPHPSMSPHHPSMSPHHQYQQHQHSGASSLFGLPAPPTSSNASNMNTNTAAASSLLSSFGQYKQSLESAFPNFSNYRNDYQNTNAAVVAAATAAANKSKMSQSSNAHMNPYISNYHHLSSTPPQANNNSVQSRDGPSSSSYSASNFASASKQQLPPPPPAVPQSPTDSQSKRQQVAESELAAERLIRKLMEQHSNVSGSSGGGAVSNRSSPNIASTNEQPRATAALTQKRNNTPTQQMTTAKPPPTTSTQQLQQLRPKTNSPAQQPMNSKANTPMQQQQHSVSSKSNTAMQQSGGASKSNMEQTGATKSTSAMQQLSNSKTAVSNSAGSANASKTTTPTTTQKQTGTSLYGALRGGANMFATSSTTKSNSLAATTSNTTTTVAPPLNMGILYPNGSSSAAAAASAELLKANKEMQIIPTTSPPGPPQNISKFNELSPSISLTAVRQTTKQSATTAAAATTTTKQQLMQNLSNKKSNSNINVSSNNSSSNNNNKINKHITQAAAATANKAIPNNNKKSQNQLAMKQIYSTSMPSISSSSAAYNTASANLKTALAAAVVAKSSSSASGNAKHVQAANQKSLVHSSASSSAAPFPTAIKKNIKKLPPITAAQLMQSSKNVAGGGSARTSSPVATSVNTFYTTPQQASSSGSRSTVQPSANFRTIQKALTKDHPNRTSPNSAQRPTNSPTITQVQKRASLNAAAVASVTTATKATAVRVSTPTLTSASSASTAATKNSFNIRPVNIKQNPSGTGVYIIETNINQKKVAIGAPTKSGGGTTVTKVPLKGKRNVNDSKDISLNETKRSKLE